MIEILEKMKMNQLRQLVQNRKINKYYNMKKVELINAITAWNNEKFYFDEIHKGR